MCLFISVITRLCSEGVGGVWFEPLLAGVPGPAVQFTHVLYVPSLGSNLLSVFTLSCLCGVKVDIEGSLSSLMHPSMTTMLEHSMVVQSLLFQASSMPWLP